MKNLIVYSVLIIVIVTWSFVAVAIDDNQREKIRKGMKIKNIKKYF